MRAIFISYRREDAEGQAGRLYDDLVRHFGEDSVFMDVSGIEAGRDFRKAIDEQVASCGVLLAMIGRNWFDAKDDSGRRRIDDPMDFVRLETASALKREIPVIPVLVGGAGMPRPELLPQDLAELAYRNAVELTHARWDSDVQVLFKALIPHVKLSKKVVFTTKAEPPLTRQLKKSWRMIAIMALVAIVVGVGSYLGYKKFSDKSKQDSIVKEKVSSDSTMRQIDSLGSAGTRPTSRNKGASEPATKKKSKMPPLIDSKDDLSPLLGTWTIAAYANDDVLDEHKAISAAQFDRTGSITFRDDSSYSATITQSNGTGSHGGTYIYTNDTLTLFSGGDIGVYEVNSITKSRMILKGVSFSVAKWQILTR
jgi:hypothetical protein